MSATTLFLAGVIIGFLLFAAARFGARFQKKKNILVGDPNVWGWFEPDGFAREEPEEDELDETDIGFLQMFNERLRGHEIPNPYGGEMPWISTNEARFRPSTGTWHLFYTGESVLMHDPEIRKKVEDIWREKQERERGEQIESADLNGRLPKKGEMYRGLGLYLCRNLKEDYARAGDPPDLDCDLELTPDGLFKNFSPVEPNPNHKDTDFPLDMGGHCTRYRGFHAAMEAMAQLMEAHGNHRHAKEFRERMMEIPAMD